MLKDLILSNDVLLKVSALLLQEFNNGLGANTHQTATVKMFPTFVRDVPNGTGKYSSVLTATMRHCQKARYYQISMQERVLYRIFLSVRAILGFQ